MITAPFLGLVHIVIWARTLLGARGLTTRSKKLLGAPGITTRSDRTLLGFDRHQVLQPAFAQPQASPCDRGGHQRTSCAGVGGGWAQLGWPCWKGTGLAHARLPCCTVARCSERYVSRSGKGFTVVWEVFPNSLLGS